MKPPKFTNPDWYLDPSSSDYCGHNIIAGGRVIAETITLDCTEITPEEKANAKVLVSAPAALGLLRQIYTASKTKNNGAIMGEAVLSPYFEDAARKVLLDAGYTEEDGPRKCTNCGFNISEYAEGETLCGACEDEDAHDPCSSCSHSHEDHQPDGQCHNGEGSGNTCACAKYVEGGGDGEVDFADKSFTRKLSDGTEIKVTWEYIGEGHSGDYDPTDAHDNPLLRFSCERRESPESEWEEIPDSSYCTRLVATVAAPEMLARFAETILDACELPSPKRRLEELSWLEAADYKKEDAA